MQLQMLEHTKMWYANVIAVITVIKVIAGDKEKGGVRIRDDTMLDELVRAFTCCSQKAQYLALLQHRFLGAIVLSVDLCAVTTQG